MFTDTVTRKPLPGDWRRRMGTKTDAHLWRDGSDYALPLCGKRIEHHQTSALANGHACTGCLVAAITRR